VALAETVRRLLARLDRSQAKLRLLIEPELAPGERIEAIIPASADPPRRTYSGAQGAYFAMLESTDGKAPSGPPNPVIVATDRRVLVYACTRHATRLIDLVKELPRDTKIGPLDAHAAWTPSALISPPLWINWRYRPDVDAADKTGSTG